MPPADSSSRPPRKRDPRLDAKPPVPANRPAERTVPPREKPPAAPSFDDIAEVPDAKPAKRRPLILAGLGSGLLIVLVGIVWAVFFRGQAADNGLAGPVAPQGAGEQSPDDQPVDELRAPQKPIKCRINTPEPGFVVFVDDQAVRDEKGVIVLTPCEVTVERGRHVIRVGKKGWNDIPRVVDVTEPIDFDQEPTYEPFAETSTAFSAPYLQAPVGKPIPLEKLQFSGRCQDPFVSANGREIWYAASGPEGMGIYYSTRASPDDEWDTPALLVLSRGADMPASPSATEDGLLVAYTVPGKVGRVWGLSRKTPEDAFDSKKPLFFVERGEPEWPTAQISTDGKRLYGLEMRDGKTSSWLASRFEVEVEFRKSEKVTLPGDRPCLSADELRQYVFDGQQLSRARRAKPTGSFSAPQVIAEPNLPDYVPHPERRQFWVTEDEQWLYYAQDPATSGNLFVVRLSAGPGRGVVVRGKPVAPKKPAKSMADDTDAPDLAIKPDPDDKPKPAVVDPRTLPTPYAAVQQAMIALLAKRDVAGAAKLIADQTGKPELQADQELLKWDGTEVEDLKNFWAAAEQAASGLKPGDSIRIGGSGFVLEKYEQGVFTLNAKTKVVQRRLDELSPGDLLALADKVIPKTDPAGQLRIGIFLHYEGKAQAAGSKTRLDRAGAAGAEFLDRLAIRRLKIIEKELARENLGTALQQIDELATAFPKSSSTAAAEKHREKIYSFVKWETRGSRKWTESAEDSSYAAAPQKMPGSLLVSSNSYENFDLSLEWRTTSATGQGGVYFRYPGTGKPLDTAFKVHLANDAGVNPDKFCTGSLFNYAMPTENAAQPGGTWNTLALQVRGERTQVTVNGKKVLQLLATDPAVPLKGNVALDGEFGGIVYRKILLVEGVPQPPPQKPK